MTDTERPWQEDRDKKKNTARYNKDRDRKTKTCILRIEDRERSDKDSKAKGHTERKNKKCLFKLQHMIERKRKGDRKRN